MRSLLFVALISIVGEAWAQHGNVQNIGSEVVLEEDTTFSVFLVSEGFGLFTTIRVFLDEQSACQYVKGVPERWNGKLFGKSIYAKCKEEGCPEEWLRLSCVPDPPIVKKWKVVKKEWTQ
jgi:hypothetical protein